MYIKIRMTTMSTMGNTFMVYGIYNDKKINSNYKDLQDLQDYECPKTLVILLVELYNDGGVLSFIELYK